MDWFKTPPIKLSERDLLGSGKRQKVRVQSDENLQTVGKSSRPITRALSRVKDTLREQSASMERNSQCQLPQDASSNIIKLDLGSLMAGACSVIMPEVEPSNMCSSTEIIEIDSASESPQISQTCNRRINNSIDIISRVKDEVSKEKDSQPEKDKSEGTTSQHDNECPSHDQQTNSHENDHGFDFPNENDSPKGSSRSGIGMARNNCRLESPNHTTSNIGAQPMEPQLGNVHSQSFTSGTENDFPSLTCTNTIGVKSDSSHILEAITTKYGDITKGCTLQSEFFKIHLLKGICMLVQKLHNTCLVKLKSDDVTKYYEIIRDAESIKFDVKWLRQYLDDIVKAKEKKNELGKLEESRSEVQQKEEELEKALKMKKEEKERLELEINQLEDELLIENSKAKKLTAKINSLATPFSASII